MFTCSTIKHGRVCATSGRDHILHSMQVDAASSKCHLSSEILVPCQTDGCEQAWFAQELLSTFGNTIGEVALIPATGGIFTVHLKHQTGGETQEALIWDRKTDGGFPEAKILKQRVRNYIDPQKGLGHSDTPSSKTVKSDADAAPAEASARSGQNCEDCA